jgi:hypothetical protein
LKNKKSDCGIGLVVGPAVGVLQQARPIRAGNRVRIEWLDAMGFRGGCYSH